MSNEENRTGIPAEEIVDIDSSKHILKHLENSEIRQQEKLDKIAETFKPGLTGFTETLADVFKQRNRTLGSSNEEPPAKRIRPQTSTDTRANAKCVIQEDHGVARTNAEQGNRYVDTSDDEEIPDDSISIPDQDHLDTEVAKLLAVRNSPDKIDLVGKISTESQALTDHFLDQLSKDLAEDEKQGPNISPHLAVIVNKLWQQNISGDRFKDRLSKYPMPENCDKIFVPRCNEETWNGENIINSHLRGQDIILQKITMQISKAASAIINVSDLILKMKDSGLQGISANAYQIQLNNLIICTVDSLPILAKSCTDLNQYRRDNMKDQFQPSLRKLTNNVPAGSALLFGDDLAGRITSLNNTTSLMKPTKMISNTEVFGKNPKNFQPSRRSSAYGKKGHSGQSNSFSGSYSTGQNRLQKQSRH